MLSCIGSFGIYYLLKKKAPCSFETVVYTKVPVTQSNIPEDQDQRQRCGYLIFHILNLPIAVVGYRSCLFLTETVGCLR